MQTMRRGAMALMTVPLLGLTGCGEHEAVREMNAVADAICACEHWQCAMSAADDIGAPADQA